MGHGHWSVDLREGNGMALDPKIQQGHMVIS